VRDELVGVHKGLLAPAEEALEQAVAVVRPQVVVVLLARLGGPAAERAGERRRANAARLVLRVRLLLRDGRRLLGGEGEDGRAD